MRIEHVAIWTHDLERLREFYTNYFGGQAGEKYTNPAIHTQFTGLSHVAFSAGPKEAVAALTDRLRSDGYAVLDGNRLEVTI